MIAKALTPILNVSDILQSFAWFEKLGWTKGFEWGTPPTFGSVCSGKCEIFLCQDGQVGRGKSTLTTTDDEGQSADKGVWMSIWVDDVDAIHRLDDEQRLVVIEAVGNRRDIYRGLVRSDGKITVGGRGRYFAPRCFWNWIGRSRTVGEVPTPLLALNSWGPA